MSGKGDPGRPWGPRWLGRRPELAAGGGGAGPDLQPVPAARPWPCCRLDGASWRSANGAARARGRRPRRALHRAARGPTTGCSRDLQGRDRDRRARRLLRRRRAGLAARRAAAPERRRPSRAASPRASSTARASTRGRSPRRTSTRPSRSGYWYDVGPQDVGRQRGRRSPSSPATSRPARTAGRGATRAARTSILTWWETVENTPGSQRYSARPHLRRPARRPAAGRAEPDGRVGLRLPPDAHRGTPMSADLAARLGAVAVAALLGRVRRQGGADPDLRPGRGPRPVPPPPPASRHPSPRLQRPGPPASGLSGPEALAAANRAVVEPDGDQMRGAVWSVPGRELRRALPPLRRRPDRDDRPLPGRRDLPEDHPAEPGPLRLQRLRRGRAGGGLAQPAGPAAHGHAQRRDGPLRLPVHGRHDLGRAGAARARAEPAGAPAPRRPRARRCPRVRSPSSTSRPRTASRPRPGSPSRGFADPFKTVVCLGAGARPAADAAGRSWPVARESRRSPTTS